MPVKDIEKATPAILKEAYEQDYHTEQERKNHVHTQVIKIVNESETLGGIPYPVIDLTTLVAKGCKKVVDFLVESFRPPGFDLTRRSIVPYYLALRAEALHLASRAPEALEAINEGETLAERFEQRNSLSGLTGSVACFSQLWVQTRLKLSLHFARLSESQRSRSRLRYKNAQKQPTQNTAGKEPVPQEDVDSDYPFGNRFQRLAFRPT
jgi:hypothetical protein